jgi:hypothetical protein
MVLSTVPSWTSVGSNVYVMCDKSNEQSSGSCGGDTASTITGVHGDHSNLAQDSQSASLSTAVSSEGVGEDAETDKPLSSVLRYENNLNTIAKHTPRDCWCSRDRPNCSCSSQSPYLDQFEERVSRRTSSIFYFGADGDASDGEEDVQDPYNPEQTGMSEGHGGGKEYTNDTKVSGDGGSTDSSSTSRG